MTKWVGVDVSKQELSVWDATGQAERRFRNSPEGIIKLVYWLDRLHPEGGMQVILEPTSVYHHHLVLGLGARGVPFTVINPRKTASYAREEGSRAKTDKADARMLAQMGSEKQMPPSDLPDEAREGLKYLRRQGDWLQEELQRARNRRETLAHSPLVPRPVFDSLDRTIQDLGKQIRENETAVKDYLKTHPQLKAEVRLLDSVKGVGWKTAVLLVGEMPAASRCGDARDWVAYAGLNPDIRQSGRMCRATLSRMGSASVRRALYFPGLAALRWNTPIQAQGERLKAKGKLGQQIIVAAMVKLLRQGFAVLKGAKPFDPEYRRPERPRLQGLYVDKQHSI